MYYTNEKLEEQLNSLKIHETKIKENLQIKNNYLLEIEDFISNLLNLIKNQTVKIEVKDHSNKIFDKNFLENLRNFSEFFNKNEKNAKKSLQFFELFLRSSFSQIENFEKNLIFQNEKISEF